MGLSTFIPAGVKISETVDPSATKNIVLIPASTIETVKLLVNYKVDTKIMAFEMLVSRDDVDISDNVSGIIGNRLQISSNAQNIGSDIVLSVTNNESSICYVKILQLN